MRKILSSVLIVALVGCTAPKLPDPTIKYPMPPAVLMQPAQNMQTISENK